MKRISMNTIEAKRLAVLEQLSLNKISQKRAAELLHLSVSRIKALIRMYRERGPTSVIHGNVGRSPHNAITQELKESIVNIYKSMYHDFNFTHFHEKLVQEHNIHLSRVSVYRVLSEYHVNSPKKKRRRNRHRRRDPRPRAGELVQIDASEHDWFETGTKYHAHAAVDDATGRVLGLYFDEEELTTAYFEVLFQMNADTGLPLEFYSDKRSCFRVNRESPPLTIEQQLGGVDARLTQFSRALDELGIDITYANTPQATGRIENLWGTFQDRLIKEMRLRNIKTLNQANAWAPEFLVQYNKRFEKPALNKEIAYLPKQANNELELLLCNQEKRVLDSGLSFSYYNRIFVLPHRVEAQRGQQVTVLESSRIGIKVKIKVKGKTMVVVPKELQSRPKVEKKITKPQYTEDINTRRKEYGRMGAAVSPWRFH